MVREKIIIYTDGGARGNPGPASAGFVIEFGGKKKGYAERIGETTNNVAEYNALILALKKAKQLVGKEKAKKSDVKINSDSELMISQLKGKYKIKNDELKNLFVEVWNLMQDFNKVSFNLVPREENKDADKLANMALDTLV